MDTISSGAEAIIYRNDKGIVKDRIAKSYRIAEIDDKLRTARTTREYKVLKKLETIDFPSPKVLSKEKTILTMEEIEGKVLKTILEEQPEKYGKEIGQLLAKMHEINIIHGDLTTSNMIYGDKLYFIDFGLSSFSDRIEDKAVDLHLIKHALESKHHTCFEACFNQILKTYAEYSIHAEIIIKRLELVELRGRNKH